MRRFLFTALALMSLAAAIAQWQYLLPSSVQLFLNDYKYEKTFSKLMSNDKTLMKESRFFPPYQVNGVEVVDAFIDIAYPGIIESLKARGVIVNCEFDGFVTAQIPIDQLEAVSRMDGVTDVEISKRLEFCTDSTLSVTHAGQVLDGIEYGLPNSYDGTGVIVGIIDAGFDYQHIAYKQADNDSITRIVRVYDPKDTTGHPATVGASTLPGSVFMGEQIDTLTTDQNGSTHGTHTSSIAAGKHVGGYGGMAPGADIVLCTSRSLNTGLSEIQVANCIKYIYAYADSVGKPCVISVSVSTLPGAHDGSDRVSKAIAQNVGPGRIFVISAGNTGSSLSYCHGPSTMEKPFHMLIGFKPNNVRYDESYYYNFTWVDSWVRNRATRSIMAFHIFDKIDKRIVWESELVNISKTIYSTEFSDYYEPDLSVDSIGYLFGMPAQTSVGKNEITCRFYNLKCKELIYDSINDFYTSRYQFGITIYPPKIMYSTQADSIYVDSWICTSQAFRTNYDGVVYVDSITDDGDTVQVALSNFYAKSSNSCSIGSYAVHDSIISVGAFTARTSYYSLNKNQIVNVSGYTLNSSPGFSSYQAEGFGPTGKALPTITAPGVAVVAAGSRYSYYQWSETTSDLVMRYNGYPYGVMSGTSMAAPTVAGIIAQWLQINPNLSPSDVKRVIAETAIKDEYTSSARFGPNGKIDAMAGARYLLGASDEPTLGDVNGDGFVAIKDVTMLINYLLTGDETGIILEMSDINQDGEVSIKDIAILINYLLTGEM